MNTSPFPQVPLQDTNLDDEKFNFSGGMGEFLASIATLILFIGLSVLLFGLKAGTGISSFMYGNFAMLIGLNLLMSEYITRHKKLVGPSIVLSVCFAVLAALFCGYFDIDQNINAVRPDNFRDMIEQRFEPSSVHNIFTVSIIAAMHIAYYLRYKTPFMLLIIAGSSILAIVVSVLNSAHFSILFIYGLCVFAVALRYDIDDKFRKTRKSDCAFWLHLASAVLIIWSVNEALHSINFEQSARQLVFLVLYAGLIVISFIINRRALISAGLVLAGIALFELFDSNTSLNVSITALTLVCIGGMVLVLSLFWHGIRAKLMKFMPDSLQNRFPVV